MSFSYLKQVSLTIPNGYTIPKGAMTAQSDKIYFAAAHATQPMMLVYDMDGNKIDEFTIYQPKAGQTFNAIAIDDENLYIISSSSAFQLTGEVHPYSKRGIARQSFDLEPVPDDINNTFQKIQGAIYIPSPPVGGTASSPHFRGGTDDSIVIVTQLTIGEGGHSVARFSPSGDYLNESFFPLSTGPGSQLLGNIEEICGATVARNHIFLLSASRILAFDRGFAYTSTADIAPLNSANDSPVAIGWNGNAILVYDNGGKLFFYGEEQPAIPTTVSKFNPQYRGRAFRHLEEPFDIIKMNTGGGITVKGTAKMGVKQSITAQGVLGSAIDLTTQVANYTIVLEYPILELEEDDYIVPNSGATDDDPPDVLAAGEKYQIKSIEGAGIRYKQVLYCIQASF